MKKSAKNFLIASGIAVGIAAFGALYHSTAKKLIKIALDREEPKSMSKGRKKLTGSKEMSEIMESLMDAAANLESCDLELVEITGHDDVKLVGHWHCPQNPKRVIVAMHGWRSSWSQDFGIIAPFWHDNNCAVLYAEQRAQGVSGGDYMGFGLLERYDCLNWINWVNERTEGKLPIYLGGISMGATTILMAAGFDLPQNVHGIVADCGFTSPHAIWKHVVQNNLHIPYGIYDAVASDMCRKKIQVGSKDYSCIDAMRECKVPVLFIHGTDDHFVPVEMTYENYKACAAPKHLFIVPGAEHGMSYLVDKEGYQQAIKNFWNNYDNIQLKPEPQKADI